MNHIDTSSFITGAVHSFPMGPHVRSWLGVTEEQYRGYLNPKPTSSELADFSDAVLARLEEEAPEHADRLVDLLEEFVGMNCPLLALKLVDAYPHQFPHGDFRAQLHLGNASMLIGDLGRAEAAFIEAQRIVPDETAPYINLAQIYGHDQMFEKSTQWCLAGLHIDNNNLKLWELWAWLQQQQKFIKTPEQEDRAPGEQLSAIIAKFAASLHSWAGASLACEIKDPQDANAKVAALEPFWSEGCRSHEFLTEYTAVLGMAGRYDLIPQIVWQLEKQLKDPLPWAVYLHLVQAYLGLSRDDEAAQALDKLKSMGDLPDHAQGLIAELAQEIGTAPTVH